VVARMSDIQFTAFYFALLVIAWRHIPGRRKRGNWSVLCMLLVSVAAYWGWFLYECCQEWEW